MSALPPEGTPRTAGPVTVVGGTYRERCTEPLGDDLRGSGLRAAALLRSLGNDVAFTTCVEEASTAEATAILHDLDVPAQVESRSESVTFSYDTPISPARWRYTADRRDLKVEAARVVAFGMVDATWQATAEHVVVDPQHGDLRTMLNATSASQGLAVVLNSHEAQRLTGLPVHQAGQRLLGEGARVVVIKQGALGGTVFCDGSGAAEYGPIPTTTTRTIGSGDAFTAGFAHAWFADPKNPVAAAHFGALVAGAHSLTDVPQVSADLLMSLPEPLQHPGQPPKVYLAAPFFSTPERLLLDTVRSGLLDAGIDVFSPFHEVGTGGDEVAVRDLDGLANCHAVLALLDGADPGTVFEAGWATHADIPVVGFAAQPTAHDWTMLRGTGAVLSDDLTSAVHSAAWAAIRSAQPATGGAP